MEQRKLPMTVSLDIDANRRNRTYSRAVMARRVLWGLFRPLFVLSPRPLFGWRNTLLRLFGAKIGKKVHIYSSAKIYMPWNLSIGDWSAIGEGVLVYNLAPVVLGVKTTVSHGAHLCAGSHDYTLPELPLITQPILIEDQVWVCADAFIGPGVRIGQGAVVGARAVVTQDVAAWRVVAGNPAREIKRRILKSTATVSDQASRLQQEE